jgi:hypothetical protein
MNSQAPPPSMIKVRAPRRGIEILSKPFGLIASAIVVIKDTDKIGII